MNYDANTNEYRQSTKDCVIVSIANFLKTDYARVIRALYEVGGIEAIQRLPISGVSTRHIVSILNNLSSSTWVEKTPRRGQENLVGIASWHRPGRKKGHATIIMFGRVKDTDGKEYSIEDYRKFYDYVLRGVITIK